jgi:hypothetical protein
MWQHSPRRLPMDNPDTNNVNKIEEWKAMGLKIDTGPFINL